MGPRPGRAHGYVGSLDDTKLRRVIGAGSHVTFVNWGAGYLLFVKEGLLLAQPFDAERLERRGEPTVIAKLGFNFRPGGGSSFSASDNGVLCISRSTLALRSWSGLTGPVTIRYCGRAGFPLQRLPVAG